MFTKEQVEWMIEFERKNGFEVMVEPGGDFDEITHYPRRNNGLDKGGVRKEWI